MSDVSLGGQSEVVARKNDNRTGRSRKSGVCIDCGGPCVGKALRCIQCRTECRKERRMVARSEGWLGFCKWDW